MRLILLTLLLTACQPSLERQPRVKPYSEKATRLAPENTLARDEAPTAPPPLDAATLKSGRDLYEVHCAVCHGFSGRGDGMAVQRGFPKPKSLTTKFTPIGETARVIKDGQGKMFGLGERLDPRTRMQIAYYVRALQWHANPPKDLR